MARPAQISDRNWRIVEEVLGVIEARSLYDSGPGVISPEELERMLDAAYRDGLGEGYRTGGDF